MRIVVDSSVWIDLLRGRSGDHVNVLRSGLRSLSTDVLMGDVVALELLQGFRAGSLLRRAAAIVDELSGVEMAGFRRVEAAARRYRELRTHGITVCKSLFGHLRRSRA